MTMRIGPPKTMKIQDIVPYVLEHYGMTISRVTAYNWLKIGMRDETLHYVTVKGPPNRKHKRVMVTTKTDVDEFLARCQIEKIK